MSRLAATALVLGTAAAFDKKAIFQFLDGLTTQIIKKNHFDAITHCVKDVKKIDVEVTAAIKDFKKKDVTDIIKGVAEIGKVLEALPKDMHDCSQAEGDFKKIAAWGTKIIHDPKKEEKIVLDNLLHHYPEVIKDVLRPRASNDS